MALILSHEQFEQLVIEALAMLPPFIQEQINNVEVLVESWPSTATLRDMGMTRNDLLLGLYHGIPLTERTSAYQLVPPDTITLYQGPIEQVARGKPDRIREQVRHTVIHEFAHHFGISDDRLRELGAY